MLLYALDGLNDSFLFFIIKAPPPFLVIYTGSIGVANKCPQGNPACEADVFNDEL